MDWPSFLSLERGKSLCLPAHGRGNALPLQIKELLQESPGVWDLPELPDIGGPLEANGVIAECQKDAALGMGVNKCWFGVNGATGLLQAALLSVARPGQCVLMPRNIHKSIIHACAFANITPVLFNLPFLSDRGHVSSPDKNWMLKVIQECNLNEWEIAAAILVNPTYNGYSSDLIPIIKLIHSYGWPVLVDEAHGTHFALDTNNNLPSSAIHAKADLTIHSLHKSLPGLVQTAVLWQQGNLVDPALVERSISWIQTSSPSLLLLASCDATLREFRSRSGLLKLKERIAAAKQISKSLVSHGVPLFENQDPLRLIWNTASKGINGIEADKYLIQRGLIAELPEPASLTFCLGFVDHIELDKLMKEMWEKLTSSFSFKEPFHSFNPPPLPLVSSTSMDCREAWTRPFKTVPIEKALGMVSAELISPYPPGIPFLIPGEKLDEDRIEWLMEQSELWLGCINTKIKVVC